MKQLNIYLKPYQSNLLEIFCGTPIFFSGKYNFANLVFSLLSKKKYINPNLEPIKTFVPDWIYEKSKGKNYLSETGTKILGDYIDSLLDIELRKFLAPYHKNPGLKIKDGVNLFIEKYNLPDTITFYERLKKKDFRNRTKKITENPAIYFNQLSILEE